VATRFGTTYTIVSGPPGAPPLVLLHATGMSSTVWCPNVGELSQAFRTYCVDIINGPGKSAQTQLLKDSDDCAAWLLETIAALGISDMFSMIGSSYGGWSTLNLALRCRTHLSKIVLLAAA